MHPAFNGGLAMANNGGEKHLEALEKTLRDVQIVKGHNYDNNNLMSHMGEVALDLREMANFILAYADNLEAGMNQFDQQIRAMIGKIHGQVNKS